MVYEQKISYLLVWKIAPSTSLVIKVTVNLYFTYGRLHSGEIKAKWDALLCLHLHVEDHVTYK